MDLHNLSHLLIFLSVSALTSSFQDNSLYGISHVTQVVSDFNLSTRYYTEVLGGMLVPKLSTGRNGINGDEHFYRIFYKEYTESQQRNVPLSQLGVPDIRSSGDYNVRWNFIMFNNLAVQLLQFVNRLSGQPYIKKDPKESIAWVTSNWLAYSADKRLIPLQQVEDILKKLEEFPEMEENLKGFVTSESVDSFRERSTQPLHSFIHQLPVRTRWMSTTRGPDRERIEIMYRKGNGLDVDLRERCKNKGVSQEMLDIPTRNIYQDSLSKRMAGITYLNVIADDRKTDEFYIDILGGKKNEADSVNKPAEFLSNAFQDYILEAKEQGLVPDENLGIKTRMYDTKPTFQFSVIQFDNINFRNFESTINDIANDPNSLTQIYRNWSSPAYINNNHYAFLVKENITMETFVKNVERQSRNRGFDKVLFSQAPGGSNINMYETPFMQGDLAGFNYLYFKGPSGEAMALSQFKGKAKEALQAAMEEYGTLSTAFPSTNPWNWDGFSRTCSWLLH